MGHIYTYDTSQNVSFPGSVSTTSAMVAAGFYESSDETLKTLKAVVNDEDYVTIKTFYF